MRTITVPEKAIRMALDPATKGVSVEFAVEVDWPELALTEDQKIANVVAFISGEPEPFPNQQIFSVLLPRLQAKS